MGCNSIKRVTDANMVRWLLNWITLQCNLMQWGAIQGSTLQWNSIKLWLKLTWFAWEGVPNWITLHWDSIAIAIWCKQSIATKRVTYANPAWPWDSYISPFSWGMNHKWTEGWLAGTEVVLLHNFIKIRSKAIKPVTNTILVGWFQRREALRLNVCTTHIMQQMQKCDQC